MELRDYWLILRRRWWIPALLIILVAALTAVTYRTPAPVYAATVRFIISVAADRNLTGVDPLLTAPQASEYIRDDFVEILHSDMFANDVNANLASSTVSNTNLRVTKDNISGSKSKEHRILTMTITWGDPEGARTIANAAAKALETQNAKYFAQLGSQGAQVTIIDGPDVAPVGSGLTQQLNIPIRLVLALAAGLVLAFVVEYLDDKVRDAREVEALGMKVMGEIPKERGRIGS
jgi:capsular polysaccharide biosynthesis protein